MARNEDAVFVTFAHNQFILFSPFLNVRVFVYVCVFTDA